MGGGGAGQPYNQFVKPSTNSVRIMKDNICVLFESHLREIIPFIFELKIPGAEFYLPNILPRIKSSI